MPKEGLIPRFCQLAAVNILSNLMVPLASLVDLAFLGHLESITPLAGVALATVLFNVIYWSFGFLRMGTTGSTAQAVGREDLREVLLIGLRSWVLAALIGTVILLLQLPLRELGFRLLQGDAEVKLAGEAYFNARIWGAPAYLLNLVSVGWFLGQAQGGRVLLISAMSNLSNVGFNYLLIVQLQLGSWGAGLATALSDYLALGVCLLLLIRVIPLTEVKRVIPVLSSLAEFKILLYLNRDILIRTFIMVMTFSMFTNLSAHLGTETLAVNTLVMQVVTLAAFCIDGFAFATESLAGIFYGQGSRQQLQQLLWISGAVSVVAGLGFAMIFVFIPQFFSLLTDQDLLLSQISDVVGWLIPILGLGGMAFMLDGYFLGLTQGRILRQSSLWSSGIGFFPVATVAYYASSTQLLWLAMTTFMAARVVSLAVQVPSTLLDLERG